MKFTSFSCLVRLFSAMLTEMHSEVKVWYLGTLYFPKKENVTIKIKLTTKLPFQNSLLNEFPGIAVSCCFSQEYKARQRLATNKK